MPTQTNFAPVRERDLRANMKEMGTEQGIIYTLERMLGEHIQDRQHVRELTKLVDQCIDQLSNVMIVADRTRDMMTALKRAQEQGDTLDRGQ